MVSPNPCSKCSSNRPPSNLSPDQREQIKKIWSTVLEGGPRAFEQRQRIEQEFRDKAVALFTPDQRAKYDQIIADYEKALATIDAERDDRFRKAIADTKSLLNDEQKKKYDEILTRHAGPPPPDGGKGAPLLSAPGDRHP